MKHYDEIVIIYNPNSTGDSKANAKELEKQLKARKLPAKCVATKYAGHAQKIACEYATKKQKTLLVSSSGDGGYNEVVNGVLAHEKTTATTYVLPSGNANDHHHATAKGTPADHIATHKEDSTDVLKVTTAVNGKPWERYAHSYAGIGLTAYIGKKLTEADLNPINEKFIVLKYLLLFQHVTIRKDRQKKRYASIIFGSIDRMSKLLKLTGANKSMRDGKMEVYELRSRSTAKLLLALLLGATKGFAPAKTTKEYSFATTRALDIQLDGEVTKIDANATVTVTCLQKKLRVIR